VAAQELEHEVLGMSSGAGGVTSLLIHDKIQSPDSGAPAAFASKDEYHDSIG
jgi:hypothetical protein